LVVLALLKRGADANKQQKTGITALHQAVENYDINMVHMLLDFGADQNIQDERGFNSIDLAKDLGFTDLEQMLLRGKQNDATSTLQGKIIYQHNFYLPELNDFRTIRIYLPPGYESGSTNYPVMYMHDGQNLFDKLTSSYGMSWEISKTVDDWVEQGRHKGFIVVGIDNNSEGMGRYNEYSPWSSECVKQYLEKTTLEVRVGGDGFAYIDCLVNTLKPYIDRHYRTQNGPENTLIGGSSMGGFISLAAAFCYPEVFGKVIACSTAVFFEEDALSTFIAESPKPENQMIYMDIGTNETSNAKLAEFPSLYVDSNERLYQLLQSKGFAVDVDLRYVIEDGAEHNEKAWARRFPHAVQWLFADQFK
jgi:predicted alpha/beta superfamily hydrolase